MFMQMEGTETGQVGSLSWVKGGLAELPENQACSPAGQAMAGHAVDRPALDQRRRHRADVVGKSMGEVLIRDVLFLGKNRRRASTSPRRNEFRSQVEVYKMPTV